MSDEDWKPSNWNKVIREKQLITGKDIVVKPVFRRCPFCSGYDFTFPISVHACPRCVSRIYSHDEVQSFAVASFTVEPCYYCGRHSVGMFKVSTRSCSKCLGRVAHVTKGFHK